jgi:hypothetical protein
MTMNNAQMLDWRRREAVEVEHLRAVLALPDAYFSPKGATHWYQVTSRSEIEARLAHHMRMVAHIDHQLTA